MRTNKKNVWKILFFSLAILNLLIVGSLFFLLTGQKADPEESKDVPPVESDVTEYATMQLTREQLNQTLADEFEDKPIDIEVTSTDVRFSTSYNVIGNTLQASMTFQPELRSDGNIILHQKSVSVGSLSLPGSKALEIVAGQPEIPEYINVDAADEKVVIDLHSIEIGEGYKLKVETFNLQQNDISFTLGK